MTQASFHFSPVDGQGGATVDAGPIHPVQAEQAPPPRTFMGFTPSGLLLLLLALVALAWAAWATREILEVRERKIVSVSLTSMMKAFVAAEAQRPQSQDSARTRTLAFLQGVEGSVQALAAEGHVVLLSEAVAGNSVPDATPAVMALVAQRMARLPAVGDSQAPAPQTKVTEVPPASVERQP